MSNLTGNVSSSDVLELVSTVKAGLNVLPNQIDIAIAGTATSLTLTYGASTLLASGAASATDRGSLIIQNLGPAQVRVGGSSDSAIYEDGLAVEPGETKVFKFASTSVDLYGRAMGYATKVKVWEV